MKKIILYTTIAGLLAGVAQAQNANVSWQSPTNITGASDVSTQGTLFGTWAPYDGGANTLPVNGVVFQGYASLPNFTTSGNDNGYGGYQNPNTPDTNYDTLLQTATYSDNGSAITLTWGDTPGHTYLIQIWANDGRGNGRTETFTGGANTSGTLDFGDAPGQYIIGTYVADGSASQTITISGAASANGNYPQLNLLQIRDITTTVVTNYQSAVLADNPLAYYALNPASDPADTSPDLSGNGNDGLAVDITAATGPSPYLTNAANFIAANTSYVDLGFGNNPDLLNFSGPISLEAWVEPANTAEFADIIAKGYDANTYQEIVVRLNGQSYGENYYGSSGSVGINGGTQATNWTYVVLSSDGSNCSLYMNGGLVAQSADTSGAANFSDAWVIGDGSSAGNTRLFTGNISEVAIYNHGLSAADVQSHYYYGTAGTNNLNYAVPIITNQPQPEANFPGNSVTFNVGVLSVLPTTNQWYSNNVPITGATNASLTLNDIQPDYAANYSVVVGNAIGTSTSIAVSLISLPPGVLEWSANTNNGTWDTGTTANWYDLADDQQTVFYTGNQVLFDDTPGVPTTVNVSGSVAPSLITVNTSTNSFSIGSGFITGSGGLVKEGSSALSIVSGANFTGPVTIGGGSVYAGNNCFDSASSITITNNATMDLGGGTIPGNKPVSVAGAIINSYDNDPGESLDVTMTGDTGFAGTARWDLASGSQVSGAHNLTIDFSGAPHDNYYQQWNSVIVGSTVPGVFVTNGTALGMVSNDTSCQNPATVFTIATNCQFLFYTGGFNGSIHVLGGGAIYIYNPNVTFNGATLTFENNSSMLTYNNSGVNTMNSAVVLNGVAHLVIGDHSMVYTNVFSGPGGFVEDYYNNNMVLSASNTYTGPTVIGDNNDDPVVALSGNGSISQSSLIFFGGNNSTQLHLDASGRSDQTFALASGQTLAGIGAVNGSLVVSPGATISPAGTNTTIGITTGANSTGGISASGAVTLSGTTVLKLNGSGVNDQIASTAAINYGGTLSLVNISGAALAAGNSFQLFNGASYNGSFTSISPATPGAGLTWNTSLLNSGGVISVMGPPQPQFTSESVSGSNLILSGTGGLTNGTYYVLTTTNLLTPLTNWMRISTNAFGANGSFSVTNAIAPGTTQQFYLIDQAP